MSEEMSGSSYSTAELPTSGDVAEALRAGEQMVAPIEIDPEKLYHVAANGTVLDNSYLLAEPRRQMGTYHAATVESFTDLVDRFLSPSTTIWIDITSDPPSILAVFNDNQGKDGKAGWGDLNAGIHLRLTAEWKHWLGLDGKMVDQETFAEHIEDGVKELANPDAATMLEIAQSIHATVNTQFRSSKRLADGEIGLVYEEEIEGKAGSKGELTIPQTFELGMAPFLGEDAYKVTARFRYRISNESLRMGYRLERPDDVILDALERIKSRLDDAYPSVYMGSPASSR